MIRGMIRRAAFKLNLAYIGCCFDDLEICIFFREKKLNFSSIRWRRDSLHFLHF
jgi:hypothetical protein